MSLEPFFYAIRIAKSETIEDVKGQPNVTETPTRQENSTVVAVPATAIETGMYYKFIFSKNQTVILVYT